MREVTAPVLLGLAGRKRAGKDTVAWRLATWHGYHAIAFADPLRAILLDVDPHLSTGMGVRELVGRLGWDEVKDTHPEVRRLLQDLGQAVRDHLGEDMFVTVAMWRVAAAHASGWPTVITDVRYPNELAAVRAAGGLVCWVDRPGLPDDGDRHPSETSLTARDCDMVVVNGGTVDDLWVVVDNLAAAITKYDMVG